jgi:hypothetical protein
MDLSGALAAVARLPLATVTESTMNQIVEANAISGQGMFIEALRQEFHMRGVAVKFEASPVT